MAAIQRKLLRSSPSGHTYITELDKGKPTEKMGHLGCFVGGLYVLGIEGAPDPTIGQQYLANGIGLAATCHAGYQGSATKLGPEEMFFKAGSKELSSANGQNRYYILRPETVETYFYLWRHTHDQKYRDWAWEVVEALEKHASCGIYGGYCGIKDARCSSSVVCW
jgi:mannosyl-oligosaccharide alpha-1,2-mannosidase